MATVRVGAFDGVRAIVIVVSAGDVPAASRLLADGGELPEQMLMRTPGLQLY